MASSSRISGSGVKSGSKKRATGTTEKWLTVSLRLLAKEPNY